MFVGDSFTWGEGLHYFSNLNNIIFHKEHSFDIREYTKSHIAFKDKHRFARIVADSLNTFEIVNANNGGSVSKNIEEIYKNSLIFPDVSCLVFQITEVFRGKFSIFSNKKNKIINVDTSIKNEQTHNTLLELFEEYGDDLDKKVNEYQIDRIKNLFIDLEQKGIVCKILSWKKDTANFCLQNEYLKNRWIYINNFSSLEELMIDNPLFSIHGVFYEKYKLQKNDCHLSLDGHKILAESIIDNLSFLNTKDEDVIIKTKNRFI